MVITVASSDDSEGSVDKSSLSFSPSDWSSAQTVTVTGLDDLLADGSQTYSVILTVNTGSTTDTTGYAELDPDDVSVTNLEFLNLGYTLTEVTGTIASAAAPSAILPPTRSPRRRPKQTPRPRLAPP